MIADARFILSIIMAYARTVQREYEGEARVWNGQRDATLQLEEFEVICFSLVLRIFLPLLMKQ